MLMLTLSRKFCKSEVSLFRSLITLAQLHCKDACVSVCLSICLRPKSFLVTWCSLSIIESSLFWARKSMNEWMGKCVWQSCIEIEGYSVTSSSPHSKCRIAELLFLVSLSSGVSAPRSWVLFHCEVAYLSLAV